MGKESNPFDSLRHQPSAGSPFRKTARPCRGQEEEVAAPPGDRRAHGQHGGDLITAGAVVTAATRAPWDVVLPSCARRALPPELKPVIDRRGRQADGPAALSPGFWFQIGKICVLSRIGRCGKAFCDLSLRHNNTITVLPRFSSENRGNTLIALPSPRTAAWPVAWYGFNPRGPRGPRPGDHRRHHDSVNVSIHSSHVGRDAMLTTSTAVRSVFQSTRPVWAATAPL